MTELFDNARLARLREGMAGRVAAMAGLDETWRAAFASVPREAFIPKVAWRDENGVGAPVDRDANPDAWTRMLYDEYESIVTQLDDGTDGGPGKYSSSSSMPSVMARMLAELPPAGARVVEVGTGTGYNAALLAERCGADNVTSVEFDRALAERAEKALVDADYPVTVLRGDGVDGLPGIVAGQQFDALICTCSIAHIPAGWLDAVPNGVIVAPFYAGWLPVGILILHAEDGRAVGRFRRDFGFMRARGHRWEAEQPETNGGRERHAMLSPHRVTANNEPGAFFLSLRLPGVDYVIETRDGLKTLTAWDNAAEQSWAVVDWVRTGPEWRVRESGPRSLWAEVEAAYATWARLGEPSPDRYAVEVADGRSSVSLHGRGVAEVAVR